MKPGGPYHLGLPAWAFPGWKDRYFVDVPTRLSSYAQVFNAVEGNTTFYAVPDPDAVLRWKKSVEHRDFRFCFKLPRSVTHDREPDLDELGRFLDAIEPLAAHLGPLLVQFPARIGPDELAAFEPVFETLAGRHRLVIEVRHRAFFEDPELLEPTLAQTGAGRVVLDSRPLYEGDRSHPDVLDALHEKPDVPVLPRVYNDIAFVRLILHPDLDSNRRFLTEWARHTAGYLAAGIETYMMIHCPNNLHCPPLALDFHRTLKAQPGAGEIADLAPWPSPQQLPLV